MHPGEILRAGEKMVSSDGKTEFRVGTSGAMAIYYWGRKVWLSNTSGSGAVLTLQSNGNLVLRDKNNKVLWNAGTNGKGADYFRVDNNGRVRLTKPGAEVWKLAPRLDALSKGQELGPNQRLLSANGKYYGVMQGDGNFVVRETSGKVRWATGTNNSGPRNTTRARFQQDGNLVLLRNGKPVYSADTHGIGADLFKVTDRGNAAIYRSGQARWVNGKHQSGNPTSNRKWGRTQGTNTGAYGHCTSGAYEKFRQYSGVYPNISGNAHNWDNSARDNGWTVVQDAEPNSIVVMEKGVHGADHQYGHVGWVTRVENRSDGRWIRVEHMNWVGFNQWSVQWFKDIGGMSYILAPRK